MSRVREITYRFINGLLLAALRWLHRGHSTTYRIGPRGISAEFEGYWFQYNLSEFGCTGNLDYSLEAENVTRSFLYSRVKTGQVFYDIGAHGGVYTIPMLGRGLVVYSFEPQSEELIANLELNGLPTDNIQSVALGEFNGTAAMTTKKRSSNHISEAGDREVTLVRLDEYAAKLGLPDPDWIKIDIEGMELPALKGAEQILRRSGAAIICEINKISDRYGTTVSDLTDYLGSLGYSMHSLENGVLNAVEGSFLPYSADWNYWFLAKDILETAESGDITP